MPSLGNLPAMHTLKLDQNRIDSIENNAFTGLYNLRTIDLRRNWLQTLDGNILVNQDKLENLWISDNVFHCDCRLSALVQWLHNTHSQRKTYQVSLDASPYEPCTVSRTAQSAKCGPKCYGKTPSEYFIDVRNNQFICTTTTTTTTTTSATTTMKVVSSLVAKDPVRLINDFPNDDMGSFLFEPFSSSTPFPIFAFDRFSLVLWMAVIAAVSLIIVLVVTLLVRFRTSKRRRFASSSNKERQSPDSAESSSSTGPLHKKSSQNNQSNWCCVESGAALTPQSRESSGLSAAERAANRSGASKSDWSPLFERNSIYKSSSIANQPQDTSATSYNSQLLLTVADDSVKRHGNAFGVEPLVYSKTTATLMRQPLMSDVRANPVVTSSATTMTLNRASMLGNGAVLYPGYKTLSRSTHNTLAVTSSSNNSSTTSGTSSQSAVSDSSPPSPTKTIGGGSVYLKPESLV